MGPFPRERFSSDVTLTPAAVSNYAHGVGDTNPVHHDAAFAAATRYGHGGAGILGDVVELRGRIRNQSGQTALGAKGRILVIARL